MNLIEFFKQHSWWGKLIGAFFGFLVAGSVGAFFGLLVGNFFDRGLVLHFSQPFLAYTNEKNSKIRQVFFESMFMTLGHFAKVDGSVSPEAIHFTNQVMHEMKLNAKQIEQAQKCFRDGKAAQFNLAYTLNKLHKAAREKPGLIHLFVETQYGLLKKIGLTEKKYAQMNQLLASLQLAPLYYSFRFARDFPNWHTINSGQTESNRQNYQRQSYRQAPPHYQATGQMDPYTLLDISPSASQSEVKRAYRRLISRYHPDKLIAKGASESTIQAATEKTQTIRKAYELICTMRGW